MTNRIQVPSSPSLSSPSPLPGTGFKPFARSTNRRLICAVAGLEKSGKTHLALTGPPPIFLCNFDIGTEGVVDKFITKGKVVYGADYHYNKADGTERWVDAWEQFKRDFAAAVRQNEGGTVIVDTASESWELHRLARFGKLDQVMPNRYGPVNAEHRELIRMAYEGKANVVFTQKMRSVYVNDKRTGDYEPSGFGDLPYLVQANFRVYHNADEGEGGFHVYIRDCRQNMGLCGMDLSGPMFDLSVLVDMALA